MRKRDQSKFWPIFAYTSALVEFDQNFSLSNTKPNTPRASPASFKHVGQAPYSRGFKFGERADQNLGPFLPTGQCWLILTKIFSLFNTQANRPRASPARFKHVEQAPYSRGFKFWEKRPIKSLVHFCLQVRSG